MALSNNWIMRICYWIFYGMFLWIKICFEILKTKVNFSKYHYHEKTGFFSSLYVALSIITSAQKDIDQVLRITIDRYQNQKRMYRRCYKTGK